MTDDLIYWLIFGAVMIGCAIRLIWGTSDEDYDDYEDKHGGRKCP